MDRQHKLEVLRNLTESDLRRDVIIPLLGRMDFRAVSEYHGPREHGKDIVCFTIDKLGQRRYLAVVAKTSNLSGAVSSSDGLMEVLHQTEQCFNEEYYDLFGMRALTMDEVWIVTSGRVIPGAADAVFGKLKKTNLAKLTRIIAGEQLLDLLEQYYPTYWSTANESADQMRGQRDRIIEFVRDLLRKLGGTEEQIRVIVTQLINSTVWRPSIEAIGAERWRVFRASAYSLTLAPLSSPYPKGLTSFQCGDLAGAFHEAQEKVRWNLLEVEEVLEKGDKVLSLGNPREFVSAFEAELDGDYPFDRRSYRGSDAISAIFELLDGLNDIDHFLKRLDDAGLRENSLRLIGELEKLEVDVEEYLKQVDMPKFSLTWRLREDEDGAHHLYLGYDRSLMPGEKGFTTMHEREVPTYRRWGDEMKQITARQVLESAQLSLREYIEKQLPPDPTDA